MKMVKNSYTRRLFPSFNTLYMEDTVPKNHYVFIYQAS